MTDNQTLSREQLMSCLETEVAKTPHRYYCAQSNSIKIVLTKKFDEALEAMVANYGHESRVRAFLLLAIIDQTAEHAPLKADFIAAQLAMNIKAAQKVVGTVERKDGLAYLENGLASLTKHMKLDRTVA